MCHELYENLNLQENFEFSGLTNNPALAYNEGDVVMLTSISEAFPFVVIEAMACEKVVVSSDVGGTKEVLEGYGHVIRPKDIDGFSKAVVEVLSNKEHSGEMEVLARERVLNGFTIDDMVDNYQKLYKSLYIQKNKNLEIGSFY
jgi:glycosyltransferase involved in cell wall biosynthesis